MLMRPYLPVPLQLNHDQRKISSLRNGGKGMSEIMGFFGNIICFVLSPAKTHLDLPVLLLFLPIESEISCLISAMTLFTKNYVQ